MKESRKVLKVILPRKIIASLLGLGLLLLGASATDALTPGQRVVVLFGQQNPVLDLKFTTGTSPSALQFSQTTPSTMFNSSGLLTYAPNNQVLNSATLSTQSVTSRVSNYILSFTGTGSVVASGTASFTLNGTGASNRVFQVFTPTAGTLTLTVSGSVTNASLAQVMAETSPRTQDLVNTGASAYFGPRYDYGCAPPQVQSCGLLVWGGYTNVIQQWNSFTTPPWTTTGASLTANAATSPDGTADAWQLKATAGTAAHATFESFTASAVTYTIQLTAAPGTANWLGLSFGLNASVDGAFFNLSTCTKGTVVAGTTATITTLPGGQCAVSATRTVSAGTSYTQIEPHTADNQAGNWNAAGTETIFIYGAQETASSFPQPYCPSGASQSTCAADVATATLPAACANGGTMQADAMWNSVAAGASATMAEVDGNATNLAILNLSAASKIIGTVTVAGSNILNVASGSAIAANVLQRANVTWGSSTSANLNGSLLGTAGAGMPASLATIRLGTNRSSGAQLNGWLQRVTIWCPPLSQPRAQYNSQYSMNWGPDRLLFAANDNRAMLRARGE